MTFKSAADKHHYVNAMFGRIAHRYDTMNRLMTGGQDRRWRKLLLQQAQLPSGGKLLDIATGTGDIAFEALQQYPDLAQVVGADFTLPMLREAKRREEETRRRGGDEARRGGDDEKRREEEEAKRRGGEETRREEEEVRAREDEMLASPSHRVPASPSHRLIASPSHRLIASPPHRLIASPPHRVPASSPPRVPTPPPLSWSGADALHLPFPDNSFDAVTSGFLMRNVINLPNALAEQWRVCKPGGRVLILEIPRPADDWLGRLFRLYFQRVVPFMGGLISGQRDAYAYLPASAEVFLRPAELKAEMEKSGLREVRYTLLMFNTVALHVGIK